MLGAPKPVAVHAWPQQMPLAVDALRSNLGLTVISVATPATHDRLLARQLIRNALRTLVGKFLDRPAASIALVSHPGQGISLDFSFAQLHLSVSHMPSSSVAAISRRSAIGVDVMHVGGLAGDMPDWAQVALDYLGPAEAAQLLFSSPAHRPAAFAEAWTRHEACLKCFGLELTEWTPALARQLASCQVMGLSLPDHCCGTVAIAKAFALESMESLAN